jgi:Tol biopolymer transport system component
VIRPTNTILTGHPVVELNPTPNVDSNPVSPDARQIAFTMSYPGGGCDLFRMNPDGTSITELTFDGAAGVVCNVVTSWYR